MIFLTCCYDCSRILKNTFELLELFSDLTMILVLFWLSDIAFTAVINDFRAMK